VIRDAFQAEVIRPAVTATTSSKSTSIDALAPLTAYLTPGTDGSLDLYDPGEFQRRAEKIQTSSPASQDGRAFRRLFYAQAKQVDIDRQGRLRIPAELMELGKLSDEVMLVGVGDHMEIWNPDQWKAYLAEKQSQFDEIAEKALG
jgi:MraZ protein